MNQVILMGRLARDPEVKYGENYTLCSFTVAVNRPKQKSEKNNVADFIRCICFGKTAEAIGNYFAKGSRILLTGSIRTGSYKDKDGKTIQSIDVNVDSFEFVDSKSNGENSAMAKMGTATDVEISF